MSTTISVAHPDPDQFEGRGNASGPDRFEVRERSRATRLDVGVRDRFGDRDQAGIYAATYTRQEPALYGGPDAPYELVVFDTEWGFHR